MTNFVGIHWCLTPNFWTVGVGWIIIIEESLLRLLSSRDCYSCRIIPSPIFISQHIRACSLGTITRDTFALDHFIEPCFQWASCSCNSTLCNNRVGFECWSQYISGAYLLPIHVIGWIERELVSRYPQTPSGLRRIIFRQIKWGRASP